MQNSNYSDRSSSVSSSVSNQQRSINKLKSPSSSEFEYLGRLVTRERPVIQKSNSAQQNPVIPRNKQNYHYAMGSHRRKMYEEMPAPSEEDDVDDELDGLSKPLGVIRISDRHFREIYRLPTPPPKVKRVYHRLRSPDPKIIERVYVQRPRPEVIENVIQVPPEKVRIIKREKYLDKPPPITRSKLVHLKSRRQQQREEVRERRTYTPVEQYSQQQTTTIPYYKSQQEQPTTIPYYTPQQEQPTTIQYTTSQPTATPYTTSQQTTIPLTTPQQPAATTLVYPPQSNLPTVGYIQSTIPPNVMFSSQQPLQIPAQQMIQPTSYTYQPQQVIQPTSYTYQPQQMIQPTSYPYQPQQTIPNYPFGFTQK